MHPCSLPCFQAYSRPNYHQLLPPSGPVVQERHWKLSSSSPPPSAGSLLTPKGVIFSLGQEDLIAMSLLQLCIIPADESRPSFSCSPFGQRLCEKNGLYPLRFQLQAVLIHRVEKFGEPSGDSGFPVSSSFGFLQSFVRFPTFFLCSPRIPSPCFKKPGVFFPVQVGLKAFPFSMMKCRSRSPFPSLPELSFFSSQNRRFTEQIPESPP